MSHEGRKLQGLAPQESVSSSQHVLKEEPDLVLLGSRFRGITPPVA